MSVRPGSTLFGDNPDTHLFIYTLAWDAHALIHQPLRIFDANFYYPNRLTLAYSENAIGSALMAAPVLWTTGNRVLALNLTQLAACVLCGIGAYVLARSLGVGTAGALISGLVFAFAPARFVRTGQLHLGPLQWMPLALACLHRYFAGAGRRSLRLAAAFFTLQAYTSGHGAVFLVLAILVVVVYRVIFGESLAPALRVRDLGVAGVLLLLPTALLYWPYHEVQVEVGLRRSLEDWAPTWQSFIASPTHVHQWLVSLFPALHVNENASAYLFPGLLPIALALVAIVARRRDHPVVPLKRPAGGGSRWTLVAALLLDGLALGAVVLAAFVGTAGPVRWRVGSEVLVSVRDVVRPLAVAAIVILVRFALRHRIRYDVRERIARVRAWRASRAARWRNDPVALYLALTIIGVWASMGPPFGIWPAVYWLPGLNFIRVPSRFMLLAILGIAVLAGIGFERLAAAFARRHDGRLAAAVAVAMAIEFAAFPLPVVPYHVDIPTADRWLATQPTPFAVAEFPITSSVRQQTAYMLHSMAHWQKTIHGYSGFEAPLHTRLYRELRGFPDDQSLRRLRELGISHIVVHEDAYAPAEWNDVRDRLDRYAQELSLEHAEAGGRVYGLRR